MKHLLLLACLLAVACGTQLFRTSFIHSVLDGPNADVYVNDNLAWSDVAPGTVTPYAAFDKSDITLNDKNIPAAMVQVYVTGTKSTYFSQGPWGVIFENTTIESGYVAIYGVYNNGNPVPGSPLFITGHYNMDTTTQNSQFCSFRPIFAGPTTGSHIRVALQKLYLGSYRTYLDSRVEQLGTSLYSTIASGEYLVTIYADQSSSPLYSTNITLANGNSYSLVIMGNSTVTAYTKPIFVQLTQDYTSAADASSSSDIQPIPPTLAPTPSLAPPQTSSNPYPPPVPPPCPPSANSASKPNYLLIGLFCVCLALFAWALRSMWGTAKQQDSPYSIQV